MFFSKIICIPERDLFYITTECSVLYIGQHGHLLERQENLSVEEKIFRQLKILRKNI